MHDPVAKPLPLMEDELRRRLQDIRARHTAIDGPVVAEVVRAVLTTMTGELTTQESSLLAEVEALGKMINETRTEIASLDMGDITESHVPIATDELDAVVAHTAMATDKILGVCETLDSLADGLVADPATAEVLRQATTAIYEACSFQDITGQRISKVINAVKAIDAKIAQIVGAFGATSRRESPRAYTAPAGVRSADDPALMRGPQLPADAMVQSDIDRLLASFE